MVPTLCHQTRKRLAVKGVWFELEVNYFVYQSGSEIRIVKALPPEHSGASYRGYAGVFRRMGCFGTFFELSAFCAR
jgi:hypothetical protein